MSHEEAIENDYKFVSSHKLQELRDFLRQRGVWMRKIDRILIAKALVNIWSNWTEWAKNEPFDPPLQSAPTPKSSNQQPASMPETESSNQQSASPNEIKLLDQPHSHLLRRVSSLTATAVIFYGRVSSSTATAINLRGRVFRTIKRARLNFVWEAKAARDDLIQAS